MEQLEPSAGEQLLEEKLSEVEQTILQPDPLEIRASADRLENDQYLVSRDSPYYLAPPSVSWALAKETDRLLVAKVLPLAELKRIARLNQLPAGVRSVEDFIDRHCPKPIPGITTAIDNFEAEDQLVRLYQPAIQSLPDYLHRHRTVPAKIALAQVGHLLEGLKVLHDQQIAHTDIAEVNVLIDNDHQLCLIDFDSSAIRLPSGKFYRGKANYNFDVNPPELFFDGAYFDADVDTYQLGVLLYRLLTGLFPFTVDSEKPYLERREEYLAVIAKGKFSIPETVPPAIHPLLRRAINPDTKRRYPDARAFLKDITTLI